MKRMIGAMLTLGLVLLPAAGAEKMDSKRAEKRQKEPFYRRYLIPGNPLDEKIRDQEKLVEADPNSAALRNDFGNLLALRRFPREAREQYEIAMELDKSNYLAPYNMGIVLETEGKTSQAIRAYEKAVDRNRGFPAGLFRLGRLYEKRGSRHQAIEAYAKALRIDPEMRDPRHNPLVVDTRLLDRASLANYERSLATASLSFDSRYADQSRFRRLPYDRTIYSEEAEVPGPPSALRPAAVAPRNPEPLAPGPGQTRPQALAPAPAPAPGTAPGTAPLGAPVLPPGAPIFATPAPAPLITPIPPPPTPEAE
jgi:tetratricopeptide (TPR) repeat protein